MSGEVPVGGIKHGNSSSIYTAPDLRGLVNDLGEVLRGSDYR